MVQYPVPITKRVETVTEDYWYIFISVYVDPSKYFCKKKKEKNLEEYKINKKIAKNSRNEDFHQIVL